MQPLRHSSFGVHPCFSFLCLAHLTLPCATCILRLLRISGTARWCISHQTRTVTLVPAGLGILQRSIHSTQARYACSATPPILSPHTIMIRNPPVASLGLLLAILLVAPASSDSLSELPPTFGVRCSAANQEFDCHELACSDGRCGFCKSTQQCQLSNARFVCIGNGLSQNDPLASQSVCLHKPLFPFDSNELASTFLTLIVGSLAAAGGIGGGGAVVPILILIDSFQAKHAVPISKAFLFGASLANAVVLWKRRHPTADRPLIDFPTVVLFVPTQIIGTQIGVTLNKARPARF